MDSSSGVSLALFLVACEDQDRGNLLKQDKEEQGSWSHRGEDAGPLRARETSAERWMGCMWGKGGQQGPGLRVVNEGMGASASSGVGVYSSPRA